MLSGFKKVSNYDKSKTTVERLKSMRWKKSLTDEAAVFVPIDQNNEDTTYNLTL